MKRKFNLSLFLIPAACLLCVNVGFSQDKRDSLKTWQQQMEYAKNKPSTVEDLGGGNAWKLIGYTYKGVIDSESTKSAVIDSIYSPDAPFPLLLPPIVVTDTTYSGDTCIITANRYPKFEVVTVGRAMEIADSLGMENVQEQFRQGLKNFIQIGWEYVDTQWDYKGNRYNSLAIVSNENGGLVFESVSSQITTGESVTKIYDGRKK